VNLNDLLETTFGFENTSIRDQNIMEPHIGLSLDVTLGMAVGRIKQKRPALHCKCPVPDWSGNAQTSMLLYSR
jgi:hypothetical protein